MSEPLLLAAIQMTSSPQVADNLQQADRLIAEAAARGARLVALPEYFPLIGASDAARLAAREIDAGDEPDPQRTPLQHFLAQAARRHRICLVAGSIPLAAWDETRLRNSCLVYGPDGRRLARYDKMHLFGFQQGAEHYDEAQTIEAGDAPVSFEWPPVGRIGLAICYDLRFPELMRALPPLDLLVVPAAFTVTTGRAHWQLLLRARAVENQCYVLAAAQGGRHPTGRQTYGHSLLIDPWGEVVACRSEEGPGVVLAAFDRQHMQDIRQCLPALRHRRL